MDAKLQEHAARAVHRFRDCLRAFLDDLLRSPEWRQSATMRAGDRKGETLLATVARERAALCGLGGADGAARRLRAER
jgi:hypothetical protein